MPTGAGASSTPIGESGAPKASEPNVFPPAFLPAFQSDPTPEGWVSPPGPASHTEGYAGKSGWNRIVEVMWVYEMT